MEHRVAHLDHPASSHPAVATLQQIIMGKWLAQALGVAAKLGVADLLKSGPRPCDELARALHVEPDALHRLLRALASADVFREEEPGRFGLTPAAQLLRSDVEGSLRATSQMAAEDWTWRPWGDLVGCVRTGEPAFEPIFGMLPFPYLARHPEAAAVFDEAMTGWSMHNAQAVASGYDFTGMSRLMDVGGGQGYLLSRILAEHPGLQGLLFETPEVAAGAGPLLAREGVADRVRVVPGDFFESIPAGMADACILKSVIHDWDDTKATAILAQCRRAVGLGGKVLLAEMVIPTGNAPHPGKLLDLEMLVMVGGRERTEDQFRRLLAGAGIRMTRVVPTASPMCVIEGVVEG
jgi:hypothetical protein